MSRNEEKDYNDEEEDTEMEDEGKEKKEDYKEDWGGKKRKRVSLEDERMKKELHMSMLPLSPIHPHDQLDEQKKDCIGDEGGRSAGQRNEESLEKFQCEDNENGHIQGSNEPLNFGGEPERATARRVY